MLLELGEKERAGKLETEGGENDGDGERENRKEKE